MWTLLLLHTLLICGLSPTADGRAIALNLGNDFVHSGPVHPFDRALDATLTEHALLSTRTEPSLLLSSSDAPHGAIDGHMTRVSDSSRPYSGQINKRAVFPNCQHSNVINVKLCESGHQGCFTCAGRLNAGLDTGIRQCPASGCGEEMFGSENLRDQREQLKEAHGGTQNAAEFSQKPAQAQPAQAQPPRADHGTWDATPKQRPQRAQTDQPSRSNGESQRSSHTKTTKKYYYGDPNDGDHPAAPRRAQNDRPSRSNGESQRSSHTKTTKKYYYGDPNDGDRPAGPRRAQTDQFPRTTRTKTTRYRFTDADAADNRGHSNSRSSRVSSQSESQSNRYAHADSRSTNQNTNGERWQRNADGTLRDTHGEIPDPEPARWVPTADGGWRDTWGEIPDPEPQLRMPQSPGLQGSSLRNSGAPSGRRPIYELPDEAHEIRRPIELPDEVYETRRPISQPKKKLGRQAVIDGLTKHLSRW